MIRASGILILDIDGRALFLKRGPVGDMAGMWCIPGGKLEEGEDALTAAVRETEEEAGYKANPKKLELLTRSAILDVDFTTFLLKGVAPFTPELGPAGAPEHTAWAWAPPDQAPEPLHPGCRISLARLTMDELGVARAIAAGELTSPQRYMNITLFAIRLTGTGAAYRDKHKEFVWRDPSIYLNEEFLARCNGLAVVWEHPPKATLDTKEYRKRSIGAIMLAFIKGDEVWGIAKVHDDEAASEMESEDLSTSPGVVLRDVDNIEFSMQGGKTLLVEGKPKLLDHVAICALGVWDKGGPPAGVLSQATGERAMADQTAANTGGDLAAAIKAGLEGVTGKMDAALLRLDSLEKARKDSEDEDKKTKEEEKADAARKDAAARFDAARKDRFGARKDGESDDDFKKRRDAEETAMCDALEKGGTPKDDARKDAARARKDWEDEEKKADAAKADAAKKDADKAKERADAALAGENATLKEQLAALTRTVTAMTVEPPAADRDAIAAAHARADTIGAMLGMRISQATPGETPSAYRKRILRGFLPHSPRLKDSGESIARCDDAALSAFEELVYGDATEAAKRADTAMVGQLIPILTRDAAGRTITTYRGDALFWMAPFMSEGNVCKINREPNPRRA